MTADLIDQTAERPAAVPELETLRHTVLSGAFAGSSDRMLGRDWEDFLTAKPRGALSRWFGAERANQLLADPDALRIALDRDIAAIDVMIGDQLDAVLHHPRLQLLEGSWRGLAWLIGGAELGSRLKVKLLDARWAELCRDLERAIEFDQSELFRKVYEQEFGMAGGEPFGLLVVDQAVRHRPAPGYPTDDVGAMEKLAGVAAAAFSPVVLGASPALLEVDGFGDLAYASDVTAPMRNEEHRRWRNLAGRQDMRFVAITLPRLLARPPWADDGTRADGFRYAEHAPDAASRVWMNAGYAFAAASLRAVAAFAWPADVRGTETDRVGGGLVADLPLEPFQTDPDHVWVRPSIEIALTDRQERTLLDAGLMPVTALAFSHELAFGAVRTLQIPQRHQGANASAADANARLSVQMNSILCASRFAHYLKVMGRDMIGSALTAEEVEQRLQTWLTQYVNRNPESGSDLRARAPLVAGRVTVRETPGKPGSYGCVVHLQPHYQLDDIAAAFQLVTTIGET